MKTNKNLILFFMIYSIMSFAQERVELGQLFLGIKGVGENEVVYHRLEAVGPVWIKNNNNEINYFIAGSEVPVYNPSAYSIGNFHQSYPASRAVFNWIWFGQYQNVGAWGLGIYKVTNSKFPDKYFYLDARNNVYPDTSVNPDIWFVYEEEKYYCYVRCNRTPIENGSLVRVSDILNLNHRTDRMLNFWENALVVIPSVSQPHTPRLVWGPISSYNATGYRTYWRYGQYGNFASLSTVNSTTYDFVHEGIALGYGSIAEYKVQAYNNNSFSNFTNTISVGVSGLYKKRHLAEINLNDYHLMQNYPNPFNPSTTIEYMIPENSFVSIKVYDLLGNEVAHLVNDYKKAGNYSVVFDAKELSSGLYFYSMKSSGKTITRKMLLAK